MEKNGIPTHHKSADIDAGLMQVRKVTEPPLEFVLRYFLPRGEHVPLFDLVRGCP